MSLWAIVPAKSLAQSKSRLATALTPAQRLELSRQLLIHTFTVLGQVRQIDAILVVSRDPQVRELALEHEVTVLVEESDGLNLALTQATHWVVTQGAGAVLVVPADLPLIIPSTLESMVQLAEPGPAVVVAPDRHGRGTNLLLVRPPGLIEYAFGPDSLHFHRQQAIARSVPIHVLRSAGTELDLDTPDDLDLCRVDIRSPLQYTLSRIRRAGTSF